MIVDNEKSKEIVPFKHLHSIIMLNIQINLNINCEASDRCGLALAYECTNAQIMTQKYMLKSSHKKDIFVVHESIRVSSLGDSPPASR